MNLKVFIDTDVIISSLISETGAASFLISESNVVRFISNVSKEEAHEVAEKLQLDEAELGKRLNKRFSKILLKESLPDIKRKDEKYVLDIDDAHIVAGAMMEKVRFLITYNIKDYRHDKIKEELGILVMRPAQFLQYLRSLK